MLNTPTGIPEEAEIVRLMFKRYLEQDPLHIICDEINGKYRRTVYRCNNKYSDGKKCETPVLGEEEIQQAFVKAVNAYLTQKSSLLASAETVLGVVGNTSSLEARLDVLTSEMNALAEQIQNIISENASTPLDHKTYLERYNSMDSEFRAQEAEFNNTELEISGKKAREVQIRNFVETIREMDAPITEFDSGLWCGLVDCVTVYDRDNIKVKFKDGTEI